MPCQSPLSLSRCAVAPSMESSRGQGRSHSHGQDHSHRHHERAKNLPSQWLMLDWGYSGTTADGLKQFLKGAQTTSLPIGVPDAGLSPSVAGVSDKAKLSPALMHV